MHMLILNKIQHTGNVETEILIKFWKRERERKKCRSVKNTRSYV